MIITLTFSLCSIQSRQSPKVVLVIARKSLELFLNWLIFYSNSMNQIAHDQRIESNLIIVCMDQHSKNELKSIFLDCQTPLQTENLANTGLQRFKALHYSFTTPFHGEDFILTDVDALWLRSPLDDIYKYSTNSGYRL
jgi:hypothetical protein